MKKDKRLHIRIDEDLQKKIKEQANKENRTLSNYVINLIIRDLKKDTK